MNCAEPQAQVTFELRPRLPLGTATRDFIRIHVAANCRVERRIIQSSGAPREGRAKGSYGPAKPGGGGVADAKLQKGRKATWCGVKVQVGAQAGVPALLQKREQACALQRGAGLPGGVTVEKRRPARSAPLSASKRRTASFGGGIRHGCLGCTRDGQASPQDHTEREQRVTWRQSASKLAHSKKATLR